MAQILKLNICINEENKNHIQKIFKGKALLRSCKGKKKRKKNKEGKKEGERNIEGERRGGEKLMAISKAK